jgi:hypothetical protein
MLSNDHDVLGWGNIVATLDFKPVRYLEEIDECLGIGDEIVSTTHADIAKKPGNFLRLKEYLFAREAKNGIDSQGELLEIEAVNESRGPEPGSKHRAWKLTDGRDLESLWMTLGQAPKRSVDRRSKSTFLSISIF